MASHPLAPHSQMHGLASKTHFWDSWISLVESRVSQNYLSEQQKMRNRVSGQCNFMAWIPCVYFQCLIWILSFLDPKLSKPKKCYQSFVCLKAWYKLPSQNPRIKALRPMACLQDDVGRKRVDDVAMHILNLGPSVSKGLPLGDRYQSVALITLQLNRPKIM